LALPPVLLQKNRTTSKKIEKSNDSEITTQNKLKIANVKAMKFTK
jgi:hypothetical protein